MDYQLFYYEDTNLSAEARWFLWQWEYHIGLYEPIEGTVKAVLSHLKMPLRQGQKTLLELKNAGVVYAAPITRGRGRPSYRYSIAQMLLSTLQGLPNEAPLSTEYIEHISQYDPLPVGGPAREADQGIANVGACSVDHKAITPSSLTQQESDEEQTKVPLSVRQPNLHHSHQRKEQLTRTNRWLLLVLLARSDMPGIVTDLSNIKLQRILGMSTNQLTSQLRKLQKLGVMAHYQPGQAGKLLGKRMTSIYQLDLSHPLLGHPDKVSTSLYYPLSRTHIATELNYGIIDALMAYGVSLINMEILSCKIKKIKAEMLHKAQNRQANSPLFLSDNLKSLKKLSESFNESQKALSYAEDILPALHHLSQTIKSFVQNCNTLKLDWLRVHIHNEAMQMLSNQWLYLWDGDTLPKTPNAEKHPEAALRHELARRLASNFHRQLREHSEEHHDIEFESLNYTLTPFYISESGQEQPLALVLRCFSLSTNGIGYLPDIIIQGTSILFSLRKYWKQHHPRVISAPTH